MSSKLFMSASLISLAILNAGCNSNLSTGQPTSKPVSPAPAQPASNSTKNSGTGTVAKTTSGTSTPNAKIAGIFACENAQNYDHCMNDEYITISSDFKSFTLEATGMLPDAPNCHLLEKGTLSAPTSDKNGVMSVNANLGQWELDADGLKNGTCTATFNSWKQPAGGIAPISLSIDGSGNILNYVNGSVNIELTRTDSTTGSSTQVDAPATTTPSTTTTSSGASAPTAPVAPAPAAATSTDAASLDLNKH